MDWKLLSSKMPRDTDYPERCHRITALTRVLNGEQYDHLPNAFSDEIGPNNEYIPLSERRPSVRSDLCRLVATDSVALLFSEGRFPTIRFDNRETAKVIHDLVKEKRLNDLMVDAAIKGSVGSIAIHFSVLKNKPHYKVMQTTFLTPEYDPMDPDSLLTITEKYKVPADELKARGYNVDPKQGMHWFMRVWNRSQEVWYQPWPCKEREHVPVVDDRRTITHGFGFVPFVWIRNLPGGSSDCDGACTFEPAISTVIEMDYSTSQAGRGLRYAADPKLVIRDPGSSDDQRITGGAANAIVLYDPQSDAKFLEINGTAAQAVTDYVKYLRSMALEAVNGFRADPDKLSAATSGRALEMLYQGPISLADKLRTSYGEGGLLKLIEMTIEASKISREGIIIHGNKYKNLDFTGAVLVWPRWFAHSAEDRQADAATAQIMSSTGVVSRQTLLRNVAKDYDIEDIEAEMALIKQEREEQAAFEADKANQMAEIQAAHKPEPKAVKSET